MLSTALQRLEARLGEHFAQLVRGLGAYGSAEFLSRLVRLATTVVIARRLAPDIVGEAAEPPAQAGYGRRRRPQPVWQIAPGRERER